MISLSKKLFAASFLAIAMATSTTFLASAASNVVTVATTEVVGQVIRKTNTRIVIRESNRDLSVIATLGDIRGRNNQRINLSQIRVGDTVRVRGTMVGNSLRADSIMVQ